MPRRVAGVFDSTRDQSANLSRRTLLKGGVALSASVAGLSALQRSSSAMANNRLRAANILMQDQALAADQVVRLPEGEPVRFDPGVTAGGKGLEDAAEPLRRPGLHRPA